MPYRLINFIAFQAGWFACVLGTGYGVSWVGPAVVTLLLALHLMLAPHAGVEARLILVIGVIGTAIDSVLRGLGVFSTEPGPLVAWLCPPWLTAMWMNFATTLHSSLSWLSKKYLLGAVLGMIAGPLAYYAGARLGALVLPANLVVSLGALAIVWGSTVPGLVRLAEVIHHPHQAEV